MEKLTSNDYENLIEAVEVWEKSDMSNGLMGAMMAGMLLGKDKEAAKEAMDEQMEEAREKADAKKHAAAVLKAKLYHAKHEAQAQEVKQGIAG